MKLKPFFEKLENTPMTLPAWLLSFSAIVMIRIGLESFSAKQGDLFTVTSFAHLYFFFISAILSLILIMWFFTKENITKISRLALYGWVISLTPPIVDLIISKGSGGYIISYLFEEPSDLFGTFVTFFGDTFTNGMTYGVRTQVALAIILVGIYVFSKTKNWFKAFGAGFSVYVVIYLFAILPTLLTIFEKWSLSITRPDIIDFAFLPQRVFSISLINPATLFDFKLGLTLTLIIMLQLSLWLFAYNKNKLIALIKNIRYSRFLLNVTALGVGIYIGIRIFSVPFAPSFFEWIVIGNIFLISFLIWLFSVGTNDIADQKIDAITNTSRPLITKELTILEVKNMSVIFALFANSIAFTLGVRFFTLSLLLTALTYLYSTQPFRLKRYPFISSLTIAFSVLVAVFMGFILFSKDQSLVDFPREVMVTVVLLFTLVTNVKDIKDHKGDEQDDVLTLPVILGMKRGKFILAILNFLSFIIFAAVLSTNPALLFIAFCFGSLAYLLTYNEKVKESYLFVLYSVFLVIVVMFAY